jgi:hypothetical protein
VSRFTNQWVVVITTPVHHNDEFVGVLGLMLRLGSFAELPGNAIRQRETGVPSEHRFAVLTDAREPQPGQVLQHPLYNRLDAKAQRDLLDHSQDAALRVPAGKWELDDHYRDPFAAASTDYDQRWLAARLPVEVRGQPTGLFVIVQESYDEVIGNGLDSLRSGLLLLSLVTLGVAAAMVVPAWVVILRMVR